MGKVESSYASVVRGVSEQVPQDRHPGQHYEQVNMVSDPVRGTARRHPSRNIAEKKISSGKTLNTAGLKALLREYREYSFFMQGIEYSLLYRAQKDANYTLMDLCYMFNKNTGQFVQCVFEAGTGLDAFKLNGLSSMTTVGDYAVGAVNNLLPAYTQTDGYAAFNKWGVAWIRGGAYGRRFTLTVTTDQGHTFSTSYITMASSYPNLLDTSDILTTDPDYQKKVNDRVNAYNSAATKWIGDSYNDQQPGNIANHLAAQMNTLIIAVEGPTRGIMGVNASTIYSGGLLNISCDDAGDGSLARTVFNTIDAPEKVSAMHIDGKIIQVKAPGQGDAYYLKFKADNGTGQFGTGTWIEAPAQTVTPTKVFLLGRFHATNGTFCFASTPAALRTLSGVAGVPDYGVSQAGDISQVGNKGYFLDHVVSHVTVFNDRLTIVSNGVVFMSRSGDYFNWFRKSSLTVADDDPIEVYALGSEDDIISRSVPYNKDLFMFGLRNQYIISGRTALTPKTAAISTAASEHGAAYARPAVSGNLLFYGRSKSARGLVPSPYVGAIAQFQLGVFEDTPETYTTTAQLDKYIKGRPIELTALVEPTTIFVRTDGTDYGVYVYSFIDQAGSQQREFDSWSRWEWSQYVGFVLGIVTFDSNLIVYTVKDDGVDLWMGAEEFNMDSELADVPYNDSYRPVSRYTADNFISPAYVARVGVDMPNIAFDDTTERFLMGSTMDKYAAFVTKYGSDLVNSAGQIGLPYQATLDITPPYVRDSNDRAVISGQLTIQNYQLSITDTAGLDAWVNRNNQGDVNVVKFNGRVLGRANNRVGYQPITTATLTVPIGCGNIRHRCRFESRTWLPMTVTAMEWSGQYFSNSRRV